MIEKNGGGKKIRALPTEVGHTAANLFALLHHVH